ncbi:MAG: hypothetical protein ABI577_13950 [bacterium]
MKMAAWFECRGAAGDVVRGCGLGPRPTCDSRRGDEAALKQQRGEVVRETCEEMGRQVGNNYIVLFGATGKEIATAAEVVDNADGARELLPEQAPELEPAENGEPS